MRTRLLLLILLAAALRLYGIQTQSLWFDEGWSAYAGTQPNLIAAFNADLTNPPLYYVLINLHTTLLGDSVFSLRLFSLFMGLITIPLSYQLGKRLAGESAGWYAAVLVAFSPLMWWASQEARMYTLLAVLILITALAWQQLITRTSRNAWIALCVAELLLLYSHNTGVVVALWLNIVTVILWLVRRKFDRPHWFDWMISQVIVSVIWLPYFVTRFLSLSDANSAVTSAPQISLELIGDVWQSFMIAPYAMVNHVPSLTLLAAITGVIALVLIRRRARWLWMHMILLSAGLVAALVVLGNNFHGRYLVMIAPLLLTALGVGIARSPAVLRLIAVIAFAVLFAVNINYGQNPLYGHDDTRGMVQYYADHLRGDDTVLAWSYADRYELAYYWDRLGVQARRVTLPEGADLDQVLPMLPTSGDVALNVWYTQRADYRGMMDCVLQHGALTPPEEHTVYGMSNLLYRDPVPLSPDLSPVNVTFTDISGNALARVDSVGAIPSLDAAAGMCIPIQITQLAPLPDELKAALIVKNSLGWEIARADAPFAQADQRTSASLAAGDSLTAYPMLHLPYAAPNTDYRIYLRLYDETDHLSGLTPPANEITSGRDLFLGIWSAYNATWDISDSPFEVDRFTFRAIPVEAPTNGQILPIEFVWNETPQTVILRNDAGMWSSQVSPTLPIIHDLPIREWREVRVPPDAQGGRATLMLEDGTILQTFEIVASPMVTVQPVFDHAVNAIFPGVGALVGYTVNEPPYTQENPPNVTLVWRAEGGAEINYTVFVQLIGDDGVVIAQSDQEPTWSPTMRWREGEYVGDIHILTFNVEPREGTLYVGLYDARTNTRMRLADGSDAVRLENAPHP